MPYHVCRQRFYCKYSTHKKHIISKVQESSFDSPFMVPQTFLQHFPPSFHIFHGIIHVRYSPKPRSSCLCLEEVLEVEQEMDSLLVRPAYMDAIKELISCGCKKKCVGNFKINACSIQVQIAHLLVLATTVDTVVNRTIDIHTVAET